VLIDSAAVGDPALKGGERGRQKSGLLEQPLGAAIGVAAGFQRVADDAVERIDRPPAPPQLVIEREHRRQQPWPKTERRRHPFLLRVFGSQAKEHFAIEVGQQAWTVRQVLLHPGVELVSRHEIGHHAHARPVRRKREIFDRSPQLLGGAPAGQDNRGAAGVPSMRHHADDRRLECPQIRSAQQPGDAWGDQRVGFGARVMRRSSSVA
jgi:hypothetical protein